MVFKLVRIDTQEPSKIQLTTGKHLIGRGKFLHNDDTDKRVSRNHAELEVTLDTVSLKSLHQNPCFFMKKSIETQLLNQDSTVSLCHGDKFGLLPDHFWYEVLHCPDQDISEEKTTTSETGENGVCNDGERIERIEGERDQNNVTPDSAAGSEEEAINFNGGEEAEDPARSASPSLLVAPDGAAEPETTEQATGEPAPVDPVAQETSDQDTEGYDPLPQVPKADDARTAVKREHSSRESSPVDVKKVKVENDAAGDSAAGPSNDQQDASDSDNKDNIAAPASPAKQAQPPARERCIYGANCYRRNPQHKAQFCHPSDADWGAEARGVCPYGRACRRADPRHWDAHTHPPGTLAPGARPPRPGKRQRRKQRRNSVSDDDDDTPGNHLIVTGKRARKTVQRQGWSDVESDGEEDPYGTDESDEWQPSSDVITSQDYSQDL